MIVNTPNKQIYTELEPGQLKELITLLDAGDKSMRKAIVLKFGATWCKPCQVIKKQCNEYYEKLPSNVIYFDLDVDDNDELYIALKSKKMINGIPTILAYGKNPNRIASAWYASDMSIIGSDKKAIDLFFNRVINF
jgi:thiol-disulfide isomerase/thioredoxin